MTDDRSSFFTMEYRFVPLFSGSSGNALYVEMGGTRVLVDAGVSGSRIMSEMQKAGLCCEGLDAVLITHEHSDHISGVGVLSRRFHLPVYATEGTWAAMENKLGRLDAANRRVLRPGEDFYIGRLNATAFAIPHDAAQPVGYTFCCDGRKLAVATDLGYVCEDWLCQVERSDILLLESNHDVDMLKAGRYPYDLKKRILGRRGHLSNEEAGVAAVQLCRRGVRHIILGHLSGENNFPELAWQTVACALNEAGIVPGVDVGLNVARRSALSGVFSLPEAVNG